MPHDDAQAFLSNLSLAQLRQFAADLSGLAAAGDALADARLNPMFDLTPGLPVCITLDFCMPCDPRVAAEEAEFAAWIGVDPGHPFNPETAQPEQTPAEAGPGGNSGGGAVGSAAAPAAPDRLIPEPLAVRAARYGMAGNDPDPVASPAEPELSPELPVASGDLTPESARQNAQEQPDGACESAPVGSPLDVSCTPAPEPENPVTPGSARALAQTAQGPRWTEDEDTRAVAMAVELLLREHHSVDQLARAIGPVMGRPVPGTAYRLRQKLSDRITAELTAATAAHAAERAAKAAAIKAERQAFAPPAPANPPAAAPLTPLGRHVANLPANRAWTRLQDIALLELLEKGFTVSEACVDLGMQFPAVKARAQELTQWDGVLKRANFTAADVLAALTAKAVTP